MDTMQVTWEGKNQTLPQVLDKFAQHKKESDKGTPYDLTGNFNTFLADERNRDITIIALLLGYEFGIEILAKDFGDVPVEPIITLKKMDDNEKIDRVIWHTIANGTSELTDKENAILRQHRTIAEASAVESPIRQETIGFPAHFFARAHNFKPPGRACQPEADSPMRT